MPDRNHRPDVNATAPILARPVRKLPAVMWAAWAGRMTGPLNLLIRGPLRAQEKQTGRGRGGGENVSTERPLLCQNLINL